MSISDRRFGVEIECGYTASGSPAERPSSEHREFTPPTPCGNCYGCTTLVYGTTQTHVQRYGVYDCDAVCDAQDDYFCDCEDCYYEDRYDRGGELDHALNVVNAATGVRFSGTYDGTCIEVQTPILQGEDGLRVLRTAMQTLKANGGYVTDHDGMHTHVDAPEFVGNQANIVKLAESWLNNEDLAYKFLADWRQDSGWCRRHITYEEVGRAKEFIKGRSDIPRDRYGYETGYRELAGLNGGRGGLNLGALIDHGSVEVRLHEGTLDEDVACSWVKFCTSFLDRVSSISKPMGKHATCKSLLKSLGIDAEAREILLTKAEECSGLVQVRFAA